MPSKLTQAKPLVLVLAAAAPLLGGCGLSLKEGAQHAHFLPQTQLEVHTALQFDMLPEPLHAEACADVKSAYDVTVMGTEKSLSRGERAAALAALEALGGKADVFYLTRSTAKLDDSGKHCGEVWGRGLRLRAHDFLPATAAGVGPIPAGAPNVAPASAPPPASAGDKTKMGF